MNIGVNLAMSEAGQGAGRMSMQGMSETAAGDHRSRLMAMAAANRLGDHDGRGRARRSLRLFRRRLHDQGAPATVDLRGAVPAAGNACWAAGVGR